MKSDLCNCLEILPETAPKLLFHLAFTALMECHSNSNQSFSPSLVAFNTYLYTFIRLSSRHLSADRLSE